MKKAILFLFLVVVLNTILQAQNVGIGLFNTTPVLRLHVSSITDSNLLLLENRNPLGQQQLTSMYFRTGSYYTGAIKTIGTSASEARLGFFTYSLNDINGLRERMSILDNGNVGIGTTNPTTLLDVTGTLRLRNGAAAGAVLTSDASGNATWQAPGGGSNIYSLGSVDFKSAGGSAPTVTVFGGSGGAYYNAAYFGNLVAPVHLPDGAKVNKIVVWYLDNDATENISFSFTGEITTSGYSGGYSDYANLNSSGAVSNSFRTVTQTLSTPITIDNESNNYSFQAYVHWSGNFNSFAIKAVKFYYTY